MIKTFMILSFSFQCHNQAKSELGTLLDVDLVILTGLQIINLLAKVL